MILHLSGLRWMGACLAALVLALAWPALAALRAADEAALSSGLAGRLIVVDPGHGGEDPGSVGALGTLEKDVVLAISLYLREYLREAGAIVLMTREQDADLSGGVGATIGERYRRGLHNRANWIAQAGGDLLLSIHANALSLRSVRGAQTFYRPDPLGQNERLARTIQTELAAITGQRDRGTSRDVHQLILDRAPSPAVTVEVGFLSNPEEERLLNEAHYQRRIAWAIFVGVGRYFAESADPSEGGR